MPTQIADIIVPAEFTAYIVENSLVSSALFQSGVAVPNGIMSAQLQAGAEFFTVPFWKDLPDTEANLSSDDPTVNSTPLKVSALQQIVRKSFVNQSWAQMDLASELSGSDALARIQNRVLAYWERQWEKRLIASLLGVLYSNVANNAADMVIDISGASNQTITLSMLFLEYVIEACVIGTMIRAKRGQIVYSEVAQFRAHPSLIIRMAFLHYLNCYRSQETLLWTVFLLCTPLLRAQQSAAVPIPESDTSVITPEGTAHVTRMVPVPTTISPEAQKSLARVWPDDAQPQPLAERRRSTDTWQTGAGKAFEALYPVDVRSSTIAGVPVRVITPPGIPAGHRDRVLINLHGGGFNSDSGSLTESVPVAALSSTKTIAVLYRLAPEHPFPAALDDAIAVYRELLKTHKPGSIAIYGTSAGAILTGEVAAKLKQLGLPEPGALGIFSGFGDWENRGDSEAIFSLRGLAGHLDVPETRTHDDYATDTNLKDPILSPIYSDLRGMPPTLFITSTRDMLLSGTTALHRAYLRAGDDAQLVVFEALPHAFWNDRSLPETREADEIMARFFTKYLGR
jgi:epsilon-lactone hydrolase